MKERFFCRILAAICVLAAVLVPLCGGADGSVTLDAAIGYDGVVTYMRRAPVTATIANHGADVSGMLSVEVSRYGSYDVYEMPVSVAAGAEVEVTLPVVLTQKQKTYTVRFTQGETVLAERTIQPEKALNPANLIVGTLGGDAQSMAWISIAKGSDPLARSEYWTPIALEEATFPDDAESLRFFDMLAVDGFDMSALSKQQWDAFDAWLQKGGIVFVGGGTRAAENFAFFKSYTGISAGAAETTDVSAALMEALGMSGAGLGRSAALVPLQNGAGAAVGEARLADATRVGDGYVVTLGFSLAEKPLSGWLGQNAILQRILLSGAQARYQKIAELRRIGEYDEQTNYADASIYGQIGVPNSEGMFWPLVLLGVFIVLAGVGGYLILKKLDRREWMWATVPALAIAASLGMWALSGSLSLREPVAVHYTAIRVDEDGAASGYSVVTAAKPAKSQMTLSVNEGEIDMTSSLSYYDIDTDASAAAPLRYIYTCGEEEAVTFQQKKAWEEHSFVVRNPPVEDMSGVQGECVWDGENLCISVTNGSAVALEEGVILTDNGFACVPALLPGQTVWRVLYPYDPDAANTAAQSASAQKAAGAAYRYSGSAAASIGVIGGSSGPTAVFVSTSSSVPNVRYPQEGVFYDNVTNPHSFSAYDYVEAYSRLTKGNGENQNLPRLNMLYNVVSVGYDALPSPFLYVAFSDEMDALRVKIDGRETARTAQRGVLVTTLRYNPISADGTARFMKNSFPVSTAALDGANRPAAGEPLSMNDYRSFALSGSPAFAFDMSAVPEGMEITKLDIDSRYDYYAYRVSLYNVETGEWDAWKEYAPSSSDNAASVSTSVPELARYIDGAKTLYARFERVQTGGEDYSDVSIPRMTMEGRVK